MSKSNTKINPVEKDRIRAEIDAQVQAFLQKGGKINVLVANQGARGTAIGSVWRTDDLSELNR